MTGYKSLENKISKLSFLIPILILALLGCTQQATQPIPKPPAKVSPPPQSTEIPVVATITIPPSKITFVRNYGDYYRWDICIANSDGTDIKRITSNASMDAHPVWSPDGTQIVFESIREWHNLPSIYAMNTDGGNVKCLTPEVECCRFPSWSPDGKKIAYSVLENIASVGSAPLFIPDSIYVMDSNGENKQHVAKGFSPSWFPDGQRIAFLSNRSGIWIVCTTSTDGSDAKEYQTCLNSSSCGVRYQAEYYPALSVSPDGKLVAFDSRDYTGKRDIYMMSFANSEINKLTGNISGSCYAPTWSPDGSRIAFTLESDGNTDIYVMNSDGSSHTLLIKNGFFPSWLREK